MFRLFLKRPCMLLRLWFFLTASMTSRLVVGKDLGRDTKETADPGHQRDIQHHVTSYLEIKIEGLELALLGDWLGTSVWLWELVNDCLCITCLIPFTLLTKLSLSRLTFHLCEYYSHCFHMTWLKLRRKEFLKFVLIL